MEEKDLLTRIKEWAEEDNYLSNAVTPYEKGYKNGIAWAKQTILEIINSEQ